MSTTSCPDPHRLLAMPSYPKAFFEKAAVHSEVGRAFVAMPFNEPHSKTMWKLIGRACEKAQLQVLRSDGLHAPKPVLLDILNEIGKAEIIIADLTSRNANVFYEVGIAHCRSDDVVLIAPRGEPLPFDLAALRCLFYDSRVDDWKQRLTEELAETLKDIRRGRPPVVIDGALARTQRIVADLKALAERPNSDLSNETVWTSSFMSIFAVDPAEEIPDAEVKAALQQERDTLLELARRGCRIKCIITPPGELSIAKAWMPHGRRRTETLLKFLHRDDPAHAHIDWVVSTMRQKNIYIIGNVSCIEGFKEHFDRSYHLSVRQTAWDAIEVNVRLLEVLFDRLARNMLVNGAGDRAAMKTATIRTLECALAFLAKAPS